MLGGESFTQSRSILLSDLQPAAKVKVQKSTKDPDVLLELGTRLAYAKLKVFPSLFSAHNIHALKKDPKGLDWTHV